MMGFVVNKQLIETKRKYTNIPNSTIKMTNTEPRKIKETIKAIIEQFDRYPKEKCNIGVRLTASVEYPY